MWLAVNSYEIPLLFKHKPVRVGTKKIKTSVGPIDVPIYSDRITPVPNVVDGKLITSDISEIDGRKLDYTEFTNWACITSDGQLISGDILDEEIDPDIICWEKEPIEL